MLAATAKDAEGRRRHHGRILHRVKLVGKPAWSIRSKCFERISGSVKAYIPTFGNGDTRIRIEAQCTIGHQPLSCATGEQMRATAAIPEPARTAAHPLDPLLRPSSLAFVGASPKPDTPGHTMLQAAAVDGYKGRVDAVNPRYEQIGDVACFPSLAACPRRYQALGRHRGGPGSMGCLPIRRWKSSRPNPCCIVSPEKSTGGWTANLYMPTLRR